MDINPVYIPSFLPAAVAGRDDSTLDPSLDQALAEVGQDGFDPPANREVVFAEMEDFHFFISPGTWDRPCFRPLFPRTLPDRQTLAGSHWEWSGFLFGSSRCSQDVYGGIEEEDQNRQENDLMNDGGHGMHEITLDSSPHEKTEDHQNSGSRTRP